MVARMKTTIELADSLAREAKRVAREDGVTLRQLIEAGLRAELERRSRPGEPLPFRFRTVSGQGLRHGVDPQRLTEAAYDLPT